jgi:hypothetical protein
VATFPNARSLNSRRVLVVGDASTGRMLSERLTSTGNDVYWARDTMEAKWLWLPNFYACVIMAVANDPAGASGLVERMRRDTPGQEVVLLDEEKLVNLLNEPAQPVQCVSDTTSRGKTLVGMGTLLKMPKRSTRPKLDLPHTGRD